MAGIVFSLCVSVIVAGTTTEAVLSVLPGVYVCRSVDRFCQCDSVTIVQDAVMIKIKATFKHGCGPSRGTSSRGAGNGTLRPWAHLFSVVELALPR